ncbi:MAG TPA: excinuclease ABC subunit UvrA [Chthoniobacteraceae bacterium]|nr:excinuclease ABC subunit UvrA [Chthoniobacteraceae bacterium]
MAAETIKITGARQHNLKNLTLQLPRQKLVVMTGLSGSGKSSLAFDTLYAEGQRRYVESLSAYARQFLDKMQKPDVDFIEGLSPAIAIEQRTSAANPRSTIATTTEIYDYLRVLFSAVGQPHDPATGEPVFKQTPQTIVDALLAFPEESRLILLAPMVEGETGEFRDVLEKIRREGFVRARVDGELVELGNPQQPVKLDKKQAHSIEAVVDRIVLRDGVRQRLADSVETALRWGGGRLFALLQEEGGSDWKEHRYSTDFTNPRTGFSMPKLTPRHFSFNSHLGACPACHGLGTEQVCDPGLIVPDAARTLKEGAILPWARANVRMKKYYAGLLESLAAAYKVPLDRPFEDLPEAFRQALFYGTGERAIEHQWGEGSKRNRVAKPFEGIVEQMHRLYEESDSELTRNRIRGYMSRRDCAVCHGARLRPEILAVTVTGEIGGAQRSCNIRQLCQLTIRDARAFLETLQLWEQERVIVAEVLREILARLGFLNEVGLSYLNLDRESGTLSGGEAQRIRLATQIGSGLAGVLYVLDEPSIGLHQRDNDRLIGTLRRLRDLGNSVVVVEHDEDTIRMADHVVDLGPGAGARGGHLIAQGSVEEIMATPGSLTGDYLSGRLQIPIPKRRVAPSGRRELATDRRLLSSGWLTLTEATGNNLQTVTASFPLGCLTCVTGVSGSGKSTLVDDTLRRALFRHFYHSKDRPEPYRALLGLDQVDKAIVIDQAPIGRTPRSNPVTYTGAFGPIRALFAQLPASRVRGYGQGRFSFNVKGGRCEHCAGDGMIRIEMHFLADVYVECEVCRGRRYNRETLEITYKGKNIADVLEMTVDEAVRFFRNVPTVSDRLRALDEVGLGYVRLGQSGTTLSGGEAQRVKLAAELAKKATGRTVYILDEPTTGLHFADIHKLLEVLLKLRDSGNTLIVIEHNLEMIKCADWVIDMGPEGGEGGGRIVGEGTPETIAALRKSHTGHYLARMLKTPAAL